MHAGECCQGWADRSGAERADGCCGASANRGDLTCWNSLARGSGGGWRRSLGKASRRGRAEGCAGRERKRLGGERERKTGWKMKRDKRRGLGWKRSRSLEAFCGCLTPLVLLMCDAHEIDRLCKTEPTGENNNNRRRTRLDGTVHRATQTPNPRRGSGAGPRNPPALPGRLAEHVSPRRQPSCFSSSDLNLGGMKGSCCPRGQILHRHQRA